MSGDGVPHSQHTNGSNTSVGGWGCRTVRQTSTLDPAHYYIPLSVRATDLYFGIRKQNRRASGFTDRAVAVGATERKRLRNIVHTCGWLGAPGACRL